MSGVRLAQERCILLSQQRENRSIEIIATQPFDALGKSLRRDRGNRAHVNDELACRQPLGDAVVSEQHRFDVRRIRQHQDDDVGRLGDGLGTIEGLAAPVDQMLRGILDAMQEDSISGRNQVFCHGAAHDAEPDKSNVHGVLLKGRV